jgi:hypothetical protein
LFLLLLFLGGDVEAAIRVKGGEAAALAAEAAAAGEEGAAPVGEAAGACCATGGAWAAAAPAVVVGPGPVGTNATRACADVDASRTTSSAAATAVAA